MNNRSILYISRVPNPHWKRSYLMANNFFNLSMIDWEDGTVNAKSLPLEGNLNSTDRSVKLESIIHVSHSGKYEITCKAGNRTKLLVDGREVYDLFFPRIGNYSGAPVDRKTSLTLTEGDHKVEVVTCFQFNPDLPDITIHGIESNSSKSLWDGFVFN
jgi:hypothetical protein